MSAHRDDLATDPVVLQLPSTRRVAWVAGGLAALVIVGAVLAVLLTLGPWDFRGRESLAEVLHPARAVGVPATASILGLAACAGLLALVGAIRRRAGQDGAGYWLGLAGVFGLLSLQQGARLHEPLGRLLDRLPLPGTDGQLAWILLVGGALLALALLYLPFVLRLRGGQRTGAVFAAFLYVTGGLGVDALEARAAHTFGSDSAVTLLVGLVELTLMLSGLALFFVVLWSVATQERWVLAPDRSGPD